MRGHSVKLIYVVDNLCASLKVDFDFGGTSIVCRWQYRSVLRNWRSYLTRAIFLLAVTGRDFMGPHRPWLLGKTVFWTHWVNNQSRTDLLWTYKQEHMNKNMTVNLLPNVTTKYFHVHVYMTRKFSLRISLLYFAVHWCIFIPFSRMSRRRAHVSSFRFLSSVTSWYLITLDWRVVAGSLVVTVVWIVHIIIYMLINPPVSPFLNSFFVKLDNAWGELLDSVCFSASGFSRCRGQSCGQNCLL